jgi:hypothetical protein
MTLAPLSLATGNPDNASNMTINQRSFQTAIATGRYSMYPGSIHIAQIHADERRLDFLAEADDMRRANLAESGSQNRAGLMGRASNLRHRLGVALVSVGHRLQHAEPQPATDQTPLGTLRTAR